MNSRAPQAWAVWIFVSGAFLLLIDLFFDWQKTTVTAADVVTVASSSGWSWGSWGVVVGILAIAVIVAALTRRAALTLGLALAMLVATAFSAFLGEASVSVSPLVGVSVETTMWPAWVGFALAAITAAAAIVPFLPPLSAPPPRVTPHGTA